MNGNEILGEHKITHQYAFTWNPDPGKRLSNTNRFTDLYDDLKLMCTCFQKCAYFKINPELTTDSQLHYHGVLNIFDFVKLHKYALPKLKGRGFIKCKSNPNEGWTEYYMKDKNVMQHYFDAVVDLPFIYTHQDDLKKLKLVLKDLETFAPLTALELSSAKSSTIYDWLRYKHVEANDLYASEE